MILLFTSPPTNATHSTPLLHLQQLLPTSSPALATPLHPSTLPPANSPYNSPPPVTPLHTSPYSSYLQQLIYTLLHIPSPYVRTTIPIFMPHHPIPWHLYFNQCTSTHLFIFTLECWLLFHHSTTHLFTRPLLTPMCSVLHRSQSAPSQYLL